LKYNLFEIQAIQITADAEELEALADFLINCSKKLKKQKVINEAINLPDSRPDPQTPVWIQVLTNQ
jgi:hypothetical protein